MNGPSPSDRASGSAGRGNFRPSLRFRRRPGAPPNPSDGPPGSPGCCRGALPPHGLGPARFAPTWFDLPGITGTQGRLFSLRRAGERAGGTAAAGRVGGRTGSADTGARRGLRPRPGRGNREGPGGSGAARPGPPGPVSAGTRVSAWGLRGGCRQRRGPAGRAWARGGCGANGAAGGMRALSPGLRGLCGCAVGESRELQPSSRAVGGSTRGWHLLRSPAALVALSFRAVTHGVIRPPQLPVLVTAAEPRCCFFSYLPFSLRVQGGVNRV